MLDSGCGFGEFIEPDPPPENPLGGVVEGGAMPLVAGGLASGALISGALIVAAPWPNLRA
jgi:hypothetical protein